MVAEMMRDPTTRVTSDVDSSRSNLDWNNLLFWYNTKLTGTLAESFTKEMSEENK
jgi:hypothetical protein